MRGPVKRPILLLIALCLCGVAASAQKSAPAPAPDLSQEAVVIEKVATKVRFEADGTAQTVQTMSLRPQSEAGVHAFGVMRFNYASANESVEVVYVRVRKPNGTVVETPRENVQEMPAEVTREAPFYSDLRELQVAVRGLSVGDTLESEVRSEVRHPQVAGQFWYAYNFRKDVVTRSEELEISVPKDKYINLKSHEVEPSIRQEGDTKIYLWRSSELAPKHAVKNRLVTKKEAPLPSVELTTFRSWDEIARWYDGLQRERVAVTPDVQAKAAEITKGLTTEREKIQALYQYVSSQFRYIAISFGIGRYQPHSAADVLANGYGDCKDKHTLLASLLKAVGVQAWPALINSGRKIEADFPSPSQFDHVITAVQEGNDILWLDSTPGVSPFGLLLATLRDHDALVIYGTRPAALVRTPAAPPFKSLFLFTADTTLSSDGVLTGSMEETMRGDLEVIFRAAFRNTPRPQWQELTQQISYGAGFLGNVSKVETGPLEDIRQAFRLSYEYKRTDYGDWEHRRIGPPLPPLLTGIRPDEEKPDSPIFLGAPGEAIAKAIVRLPPGESVKPQPNLELKEDFAEYYATYRMGDGVLSVERRLVIKKAEVGQDEWEKYKSFAKAVQEDHGTLVPLRLASNVPPSDKAAATPGDGASEANRYFERARQAIAAKNFGSAREDMEEVLRLDPTRFDAWATMAVMEAIVNHPDQAISDFRKELEYHPENQRVWGALAEYEARLRRRIEAMETYRTMLSKWPDNKQARAAYASMLLWDKRYQDAIAVYDEGLKIDPKSASMHSLKGVAYGRMGDKEKAVAEFNQAIELDPGTDTANSVAYELAEVGAELPRAEEYARKAVNEIESQTLTIELGMIKDAEIREMNTLAAYWDTLGWVEFKLGKLPDAERYLNSAWMLTQNAVEGDHLGQVYEAEKKWSAAAKQYELAATTSIGPEKPDIEERARAARIKAGPPDTPNVMDAIKRGGPGKTVTFAVGPGGQLSEMRTIHLGAAKDRSGTAVFLVLLSPGAKVEDVRFSKGKTDLMDMEKQLRKAHFEQPFPDHNPTRIVRRGLLICNAKVTCEFTLTPADSVTSVQ